jgi:hypothetical protein
VWGGLLAVAAVPAVLPYSLPVAGACLSNPVACNQIAIDLMDPMPGGSSIAGASLAVEGLGAVLNPAGHLIGIAGSSERIRVLRGGTSVAEALFTQLSKGGQVVPKSSYPGIIVYIEGVGTVGYRPLSKSGPPTIDVNIIGIAIKKLKFLE